jgi:hypothetical protein
MSMALARKGVDLAREGVDFPVIQELIVASDTTSNSAL